MLNKEIVLLSLENLIPKKILEEQYGQAELGIYSAMANLAVVVQVFASVVFNPFLPKFTELYYQEDRRQFRRALHKLYLVLAGMCVIVNLGVFVFGRLGLRILYGADILHPYCSSKIFLGIKFSKLSKNVNATIGRHVFSS